MAKIGDKKRNSGDSGKKQRVKPNMTDDQAGSPVKKTDADIIPDNLQDDNVDKKNKKRQRGKGLDQMPGKLNYGENIIKGSKNN
jgi:hypothetical protein